jgi:aerobic-type carbon monoxide dehydrogenase small subunit (CoxS/CutS family)
MPDSIVVNVNGRAVEVPAGATAAVAVLLSEGAGRISISGQLRAAFCGMGTCFECRVEIDGQAQRRSCQVLCEGNMRIECYGWG